MPRVARIEERQVEGTGTRLGRESTVPSGEYFGGGRGRERLQGGIESALGAAQKLIQEERDKADRAAVRAAGTSYKKTYIETKNSYANEKGLNAMKKREEYNRKMRSRRMELDQNLNERQRERFAELADRVDLDWGGYSLGHERVESERFASEQEQASIKLAGETMAENALNPKVLEREVAELREVADERAARKGLSRDAAKAYKTTVESSAHLGVIVALVDGEKDIEAEKYLKKKSKMMTAEDRSRATRLVEDSSIRGYSQRKVDEIFEGLPSGMAIYAGVGEEVREKPTLGSLLELARSEPDPKRRDEIVRRTKQRWADEQAVAKAEYDDIFSNAKEWAGNNPGKDPALMPPAIWSGLSAKDQKTIRGGFSKKEQDFSYLDFLDKVKDGTAKNMSRPDFDRYWLKATPGQRKKMETAYIGAKKGKTDKFTQVLRIPERIRIEAAKNGLIADKKTSKLGAADLGTLNSILQDMQTDFDNNPNMTIPEVQEAIEKKLARVYVDEWGFDPLKSPLDVPVDQRADTYFDIDNMTETEIKEITNLIRSYGGRPTNDKIQRIYPQLYHYNDRAAQAAIARE